MGQVTGTPPTNTYQGNVLVSEAVCFFLHLLSLCIRDIQPLPQGLDGFT